MKKVNAIAAVVVTYHPKHKLLNQLITSLSRQVDLIIIVNNSPCASLGISAKGYGTSIETLDLDKNYGIAYAQNIGLERAALLGFQYALLMDQDSIPEDNMVAKLHNTFVMGGAEQANIIAAGPSYVDPRSKVRSYFMVSKFGVPFRYKPNKKNNPLDSVNVTFLISSGSLISIPKLLQIGGKRSNYFIDHVDTEWCLRAKSKGYTLVGVHSALMEHSLGDRVKRIWFFYLRSVAYHSPLRDYYMFRNTILMLRDTEIPLLWATFLSLRLVQFAAYFLLLTGDRKNRLRTMWLGIKHGFQGTDGEVDLTTEKCTPIPITSIDPS
jgi:rhamnosyltransferase